ncbi:hypothetical protein XENOCAPTIV_008370, partial [Xenoophorus captivus]
GPPKHKPPPPVKAGSSTEMVSDRHGFKSILIVTTIILWSHTHTLTHTHTQIQNIHLGSHNGANGY